MVVCAYAGVMVLFLHDPPARDISAFPTRRSSDLWSAARLLTTPGGPHADGRRPPRAARCDPGARRPRAQPEEHRRDRKSTRLNSSHVAISYAVFCLKKKTSGAAFGL